jgi:hypothetical protein
MSQLFSALASYFNPAIVFFTSVASIVALVLGCILDPAGAINTFICKVLDIIASVFPSTPDNLKLGFFVNQASAFLPAFGASIIGDIVSTISSIFLISLAVRVYKLIPFKAT